MFQNALGWFLNEIKDNIMFLVVENNCQLIAIIDWLTFQFQLINWKQNNWLQRLQLIFYNSCTPHFWGRIKGGYE